MKTLSHSISDTFLIMGDGQGQNITHAQCMTDLACTVHQYTSEKYNVKVDNQKNKTKFNSKNKSKVWKYSLEVQCTSWQTDSQNKV